MVHLYKELQPADHFEISLPHMLSTNERQLLTLFYQPLTGPEPISLYLTLWAEGEDVHTGSLTHYYLMSVLNMPIGKVFEARIALEAIGLLRTWRKDEHDNRVFIYELIRPLEAHTFFQDPLLSMFLFSKIGEQAYRKLRKRFVKPLKKDHYTDVSRSFIDVYKPIHTNVPKELMGEDQSIQSQGYPFYFEQFDFNLLMSGLSEQLIPSSSISLEVKETIAKLAFLYHLSPLDMQKVVILALDENMHIHSDKLRKAAADYYKLTISKDAPKLEKTFAKREVPTNVKLSKEQERQHYLETTPPIQVLRDINQGKEPLASSVKLAEDLIMKHGMPVGVVNVLLEYVMLTTDMKLPKNYVERIADHWMRKNLKTAKEAMELARTERDKYTAWKNENEKKTTGTKSNTGGYKKQPRASKEIVPEWFDKRNEKSVSETPDAAKQKEYEERRKKLLEALGQEDQEVN
ncbi:MULTISPECIES: replication initiation and membrane attachment family protein [Lysinibacillus]|uniref:Helicase DnaB n=1 Tax=Lysinibacillus antri TaxID=2498145 RepID=A0A432LHW5_9BACI|nr:MULTISPECIES: DnaD domain protein [Lysinibacillus]RUL56405.1 helicase DnaB [Lysinibacillus antri]TSI03124.1 helicase DnaB [Lysinibacillus sp. BW-2-10]